MYSYFIYFIYLFRFFYIFCIFCTYIITARPSCRVLKDAAQRFPNIVALVAQPTVMHIIAQVEHTRAERNVLETAAHPFIVILYDFHVGRTQ